MAHDGQGKVRILFEKSLAFMQTLGRTARQAEDQRTATPEHHRRGVNGERRVDMAKRIVEPAHVQHDLRANMLDVRGPRVGTQGDPGSCPDLHSTSNRGSRAARLQSHLAWALFGSSRSAFSVRLCTRSSSDFDDA